MNEYDSARLAALLEFQGMQSAKNSEDADIIYVNTCSVRAKAEENAISRIRDLKPLKDKNKNLKICVLGCMAKNRGESLRKDLPFIDDIIDNSQLSTLNSQLAKLTNNYSAFIAIQSGCNMKCSYCIVPYVRGAEQYREPDSVLREIKAVAAKGVSEVVLLGQTVNGYRSKDLNFVGLLKQVANIKGVERIRFMSPHPRLYSGELMELLQSEPKMAPHVHLPVQSGSNSILKKMKRQYTRENYLSITETLRAANPLYGITTDIICGYPGETDEEFEETLSLLREVEFDNAFMFAYSPREGTPAASEKELITEKEKKARLQKTIDLQHSITLERAKLMIGRQEKILLEKPSRRNSSEWVGKTGNFKKAIVPAQQNFKEGMYINCTINGIKGHTLLAVLIFFLFLISCDKKKKEAITIKNEIPSSSSVQEENQLQSDLQIDENLEYEEFIYASTFNNAPTAIRTTATNLGTKPRKATFQYWLDGGFSQTVSITKEIPPRTRMAIEPSAELKLTRNAFAIKNETQTVLQTRVYGLEDGKKLPLFERSYKVKLFPPQFFNWQTPELIAAFVTYQMDSMPALQREISRKVGSIMSYQAGPEKAEEQVKAVYDIIAERRWHYLTGFSISTGGQKVRYPIETLREKSANCIEGTLLFSAIIESLNIETAIVLVNRPEGRHAYLAWKSDPKGDFDKFIETTAAFAASDAVNYEKAASVGAQGAYDDDKGGYIEKVIAVRKMWNSGVSVNELP